MRRGTKPRQPARRKHDAGIERASLGRHASLRAITLALAAGISIAGCGEQIIKHGHQFTENDVQQIQVGMTQEQVRLSLGTPTTTATINNGAAYYYIASTASQTAFMKPKEVDRKVLAVYFNPLGSVDQVANYGMKDGRVFDTVSRKTPAPGGKDEGILKSLFRNLGTRQVFGE